MKQDRTQDQRPWATCLFTDILITYLEETADGATAIDYPALFRGIEGIEMPPDPRSFLKDTNNWVPLQVYRELLFQCERISGKKDAAYHAARAYFEPGKKQIPSLIELILRVIDDLRLTFICANLWGAVQTNYLKLQSFETPGSKTELHMLAKFDESARPTVGTIYLVRGICEGMACLYSFVEQVCCVEEISQVQVEDIISEFPDFAVTKNGHELTVCHQNSQRSVMKAIEIPLRSESIPISQKFLLGPPEAMVVSPHNGRIGVITSAEETDPQKRARAVSAYKIVQSGVVTHGNLTYSFERDHIYNAPYGCFRISWRENLQRERESSAEDVRREISSLLFDHLKQIKQAQTRMFEINIEKRRLTLENIRLRREIEREYSFAGIVGQSEKIKDLFGLVRSVAETDVAVIIQGETGTGKELIARAIHYNSPRKAKRFVAINCGALSETLLESELFGHEKGAFTGATTQRKGIFEVADGGTLFLDEVGEITPSTQIKLLRILQEGEFQRVGGTDPIKVDVRIIAATNQNLEELVKKGPFRQDFYYRLNVFPIMVPPLRERPEDISLLVSHFIEKRKKSMNREISGASPQAMALLMAHSWPGNVRELENVIQRMMVVSKGDLLDVQDLPPEIRGKEARTEDRPTSLKGISRESAEILEKRTILDALSKIGGNVTKAAKALGISRATLQNKMKTYRLRGSKN